MKSNPILTEIRRTREDLAREADYNLQRLFDYVRERERKAATRGVKFVSPAPRETEAAYALREEQPRPKPGQKP
jgi:hypothetical protein